MKDITVQKNVTLKNVGTEVVTFRYYSVNFGETLQPEDSVIVTALSSEELAYYVALADEAKGLSVEVEGTSEETTEEPEPPEETPDDEDDSPTE